MPLLPLPDSVLSPLVETALREDLGAGGDITTAATIAADMKGEAFLNARQAGVVAGMDLARLAFRLFDPAVAFTPLKQDGDIIAPGDTLARVTGPMRSLLSAERVALNFMCWLSGIATETHKLVEAVKPHKTLIRCTRKTTPGLRVLEKYAVRAGGGQNHRFGLYDMALIKDNHIAAAGGVKPALERLYKTIGKNIKVELEVDTLEQLDEALALLPACPVDIILLDNMNTATLRKAVEKVAGRIETEASGGITPANVAAVAATGVDAIAIGWITHSAPILDIGMDEA